jgi:hypothetical protein
MKHLFGMKSNIFLPPMDQFNNDTINAMSRLGIKILSYVNQGGSISNHNKNISVAVATVPYKVYEHEKWVKSPIPELMKDISASIEHYGYTVVVLHPMDFVKVDVKGQFTNVVDENEIKDLSHLVDYVLSKDMHITSFSKLILSS